MTYTEARKAIEEGKFVTRTSWITGEGEDLEADYLGKDDLGLFWRSGGFKRTYDCWGGYTKTGKRVESASLRWFTVTADFPIPSLEELEASDWCIFEIPQVTKNKD